MGDTCKCGRALAISDIVRKCFGCGRKMCASCIASKRDKGQNYLCVTCDSHFEGRKVIFANDIKGEKKDGTSVRYALMDDAGKPMIFEIDGKMVMAYSKDLEQITRIADRLMDDRLSGLNFRMGRAYIPNDTKYLPMNIKMGDKQNIHLVQTYKEVIPQ